MCRYMPSRLCNFNTMAGPSQHSPVYRRAGIPETSTAPSLQRRRTCADGSYTPEFAPPPLPDTGCISKTCGGGPCAASSGSSAAYTGAGDGAAPSFFAYILCRHVGSRRNTMKIMTKKMQITPTIPPSTHPIISPILSRPLPPSPASRDLSSVSGEGVMVVVTVLIVVVVVGSGGVTVVNKVSMWVMVWVGMGSLGSLRIVITVACSMQRYMDGEGFPGQRYVAQAPNCKVWQHPVLGPTASHAPLGKAAKS